MEEKQQQMQEQQKHRVQEGATNLTRQITFTSENHLRWNLFIILSFLLQWNTEKPVKLAGFRRRT